MNNKLIFFTITTFAIFLMGVCVYCNGQVQEEDISSYKISSRQDCWQIKDNQEYNNCLTFYLIKSPYSDNEKLVATRLVD